ncbi:hypothetical protein D9758_010368 [Tetrapyrgos nigripes]|uniref:F-box domain-containing protein n=1 Tax=Tetrapyrgos nigripes TaxID=182062 RepID=A0A8H5CZJ3_9AGAR|nr:hypothetical protein D9758_010368 [Tetrapyrgos nigripes]
MEIPTELLAKIFIHCLPSESESDDSMAHSSFRLQDAPLLLTKVCREWRSVALHEPRLWCTLHVRIPRAVNTKNLEFWESRMEGIRKWLDRSGQVPLSLAFSGGPNMYPVPTTAAAPYHSFVLQLEILFASQSHRWKSLELEGYFLIEPFFVNPREHASILDSVKIEFTPFFHIPAIQEHLLKYCLGISSLRRLHLRGYELFDTSWVRFPWSNLTEIVLQPIIRGEGPLLTLATALDILSQASNLRLCVMDLTAVEDAIIRNRERAPIILPFLRILDIYLAINLQGVSYASEDDAKHVFSPLITPRLETLTMRSRVRQIPPFSLHIPFLCFFSQPGPPPITTLKMEIHINLRSCIECLRLVPNLQSLSLNHLIVKPTPDSTNPGDNSPGCSSEDLFRSLIPSPDNPTPLCPRLESLELIQYDDLSDPTVLFALAKARNDISGLSTH